MSQDSSAEVATIEPKQDNKAAKLEAMIDNLGAKKIQAFDDDLPF